MDITVITDLRVAADYVDVRRWCVLPAGLAGVCFVNFICFNNVSDLIL